jgi:hypothetical protein
MPIVNIDGKEYDSDKLSAEAKAQLASLQVTDAEIQRLQMQLAIFQTARSAYASGLKASLSDSLINGVSVGGSLKI